MKTEDNTISFYKINNSDFLVSENNFSFEKIFVLNDKNTSASEKEIFADYFNTVYAVFLQKLKKFKELKCKVSDEEEKSLTNMFKTLIDTQKMLCGKDDED